MKNLCYAFIYGVTLRAWWTLDGTFPHISFCKFFPTSILYVGLKFGIYVTIPTVKFANQGQNVLVNINRRVSCMKISRQLWNGTSEDPLTEWCLVDLETEMSGFK